MASYQEKGADLNHTVTYTYDAENNLSAMEEVTNGVSKTYAFTYNGDNRLTSMLVDGTSVTYIYDAFGRVESRTVRQGDTVIETVTPGYYETSSTTSGRVVSYNGYTYSYDGNGNIETISDGTYTVSYEYDSANQLIRENNPAYGYTHIWVYDNAGNILFRKEYAYTTYDLTGVTPLKTVAYTYGNENWGDLLTGYDGKTITYDVNGNPLSDGTWAYTWKHGRQLASMTAGNTTWSYTYNADGLRTKRTDGTHTYTYVYDGSQLTSMTKGTDTLHFTYDALGVPLSVRYNGTAYWISTNLQGDIIRILDSTGNSVVSYTYDAWGNLLSCTGTMAETLGTLNPLRYRGYVYDTETGLYYLQSRYYNPQWGRFINADGYVSTGQGLLGNNMFAYCNNNPVLFCDPSGEALIEAFIIKYGTVCAFTLVIAGVVIISDVMYKSIEAIVNWLSQQWYVFCAEIKYTIEEHITIPQETSVNYATEVPSTPVSVPLKPVSTQSHGSVLDVIYNMHTAKPVNLPSWKKLKLNIDHIASGHMPGGSRNPSGNKSVFYGLTIQQMSNAIQEAYNNCSRVRSNGIRILVEGKSETYNVVIQMWINIYDHIIETAYPVG